MNRKTYYVTVLAFVFALSLVLSGCGGGSKTTQTGIGGNSGDNAKKTEGTQKTSDYPAMVIKFSHTQAETTPKGQAALKFKEVVESKSGSKIKVQVYPSGQLYGDNDELEALQANNVQMIAPTSAKLGGFDETYELYDLPFLFKNEDHVYKFEDGEIGKQLLSKLEPKNIKGLAFWPNGMKHMTNNKVEITKPSDLKGLKVRTHGGKIINDVYSQLGAVSTKVAVNEAYQALQLGTVDGQENSLANIYTEKYEEVQKYMSLTGHTRSEYVVATNKKWFDGLTPDTQALINDAMKEATKKGREISTEADNTIADKIKKNGKMKVHELTADERQAFLDALKPVYDKWLPQMDANIIKAIQDAGK
jgi:C4-dicarboxylate-binding protein DctP